MYFSSVIIVVKDSLFWQALKVILLFVLALFILSFFLHLGKRSKLSVFVLFLGILVTGAAGSGPVTELLLKELQPYSAPLKPEWKDRNLIIVLGSGQSRWSADYVSPQVFGISRTAEAARLYLECKKAGKACTVIASGGDPGGSGEAEATTMKVLLQKLGVSESDIMAETESRNTYENARNVLAYLKQHMIEVSSFNQLILVTSGFHMKRSELCFRLNNMTVIPAPADYIKAAATIYPNVVNLYFSNLIAHEYAGVLKAYLLYTSGISF
ncbi:MAG: hypothetical protein K0R29_2980 [Pseudobdellovibrio sp.]|nr:hypothetical protein [Pseudobdellovibrio sp.]